MPYVRVDDADLFHEVRGEGQAVVLVHGSWGDHTEWAGVAAILGERHRVVAYDRRGHSRSGRGDGPRSRRQDEDDLAALIEALGCAPAHVVGNSLGGSIALGLAARRPALLASVCVHEPPLIGRAPVDPGLEPLLGDVRRRIAEVARALAAGDPAGGARRFVEEVALGPGGWEWLPAEARALMVRNAGAFLDDVGDPAWADLAIPPDGGPGAPALVTRGGQSPDWLREVAASLAERIPGARGLTLEGAGHLPHETDPPRYAAVIDDAIAAARPAAGAARDTAEGART